MSNNFYWIVPEVEPRPSRTITTPAGDVIEVDMPVRRFGHSNDPRVHIGKGVGRRFYWAQDPAKVRKVCHERRDEEIIEDECATRYTGAAFLEYIEGDEDILNSIGQHFS